MFRVKKFLNPEDGTNNKSQNAGFQFSILTRRRVITQKDHFNTMNHGESSKFNKLCYKFKAIAFYLEKRGSRKSWEFANNILIAKKLST
jgi:hypothetical protein